MAEEESGGDLDVLVEVLLDRKLFEVKEILDSNGIRKGIDYTFLKPNLQTKDIFVLGISNEHAGMKVQQALTAGYSGEFISVTRLLIGHMWGVCFKNKKNDM